MYPPDGGQKGVSSFDTSLETGGNELCMSRNLSLNYCVDIITICWSRDKAVQSRAPLWPFWMSNRHWLEMSRHMTIYCSTEGSRDSRVINIWKNLKPLEWMRSQRMSLAGKVVVLSAFEDRIRNKEALKKRQEEEDHGDIKANNREPPHPHPHPRRKWSIDSYTAERLIMMKTRHKDYCWPRGFRGALGGKSRPEEVKNNWLVGRWGNKSKNLVQGVREGCRIKAPAIRDDRK